MSLSHLVQAIPLAAALAACPIGAAFAEEQKRFDPSKISRALEEGAKESAKADPAADAAIETRIRSALSRCLDPLGEEKAKLPRFKVKLWLNESGRPTAVSFTDEPSLLSTTEREAIRGLFGSCVADGLPAQLYHRWRTISIRWDPETPAADAQRAPSEEVPSARNAAPAPAVAETPKPKEASPAAPSAQTDVAPRPKDDELDYDTCFELVSPNYKITSDLMTQIRKDKNKLSSAYLKKVCSNKEAMNDVNDFLFGCTRSMAAIGAAPELSKFKTEIELMPKMLRFLNSSCGWPTPATTNSGDAGAPQADSREAATAAGQAAEAQPVQSGPATSGDYDKNIGAIESYVSGGSRFRELYPEPALRVLIVQTTISVALVKRGFVPEAGLNPTKFTADQWARFTTGASCLAQRHPEIVARNRTLASASDPLDRNRANDLIEVYRDPALDRRRFVSALGAHMDAVIGAVLQIDDCGLSRLKPGQAEVMTFERHAACVKQTDDFYSQNRQGISTIIDLFTKSSERSDKQTAAFITKNLPVMQSACRKWAPFLDKFRERQCGDISAETIEIIPPISKMMASCPSILKSE